MGEHNMNNMSTTQILKTGLCDKYYDVTFSQGSLVNTHFIVEAVDAVDALSITLQAVLKASNVVPSDKKMNKLVKMFRPSVTENND